MVEEKFIPLRLCALTTPTRRVKLVEFVFHLKSMEAIAAILKKLRRNNVKVLNGQHWTLNQKAEEKCWMIFVDMAKSKTTLQELKGSLVKLDAVIDVKGDRIKYGVESFCFPITLDKTADALVFNRKAMVESYQRLSELFAGGAAVILYHAGFAGGFQIGEWLKSLYKDVKVTDLLSVAKELYRALGWGVVKFGDLDVGRESRKLIVRGSFEAKQRASPTPVCHFMRGHISGVLSSIIGKRLMLIEELCIAKGDPYCSFVIKSIGKF